MKITTDWKFKNFKYRYEVPEKVLKDQFSHLSEEDSCDGFFRYRKSWYHLSDFMVCSKGSPLGAWDGYSSDSFFSGVLIRCSKDNERYMVATYTS